jgi:outer membrane protein insertion porin family
MKFYSVMLFLWGTVLLGLAKESNEMRGIGRTVENSIYEPFSKETNRTHQEKNELTLKIQDPWNRTLSDWGVPLNIKYKEIQEILTILRARLFLEGYYFAKIHMQFLNADNTQILSIEVLPGAGYLLGASKVQGTKTSSRVVERLGLLQRGTVFYEPNLEKAREKLLRTGYFEWIEYPGLYKGKTKNVIHPLWNIQDEKINKIKGVLGYESEQNVGLTGLLEIFLRNMRGTARDFYFKFSSNIQASSIGNANFSSSKKRVERDIHLQYKEPWLGSLPLGVVGTIDIKSIDSVYEETALGIQLFQDIDYRSSYSVQGKWETNTTYVSIGDSVYTTSTNAYTTGLGFIYDWRNQVPYTTKGGYFTLELEGIQRSSSSNMDVLSRNKGSLSMWYPLWKSANRNVQWIVYQSLNGGGTFPFSKSIQNRGNLFQLGGATTIRGYRENLFLTSMYGYHNLEIRFIPAPKNEFFVFWDGAWIQPLETYFTYRSNNWKQGYGIGMRLGTGNWVTAITYALSPEKDFGEALLHMSVENYF